MMVRARLRDWCFLLFLPLTGLTGASCVAKEAYQPSDGAAGRSGAANNLGGLGGSLMTGPVAGTSDVGGGGGSSDVAPDTGGPACANSGQCGPPYPYCQPSLGRCVECTANRNCIGTGRPYCDARSFKCSICLEDAQCTKFAPYCALAIGDCVECLSSANCGTSGLVCDRLNFHCVPSCTSNADCVSAAQTPFCDPERSLCVSCVSDEDCPAAAPRCNTRAQACLQCLTNLDCETGANCVAGICANPK